MKKVLVTGSQSYIGTILAPYLAKSNYAVTGIDSGFIRDCLLYPEEKTKTIYKDVRDLKEKDLKGYDVVVYLAGISNDPFKNFDPVKVYNPVRKHTVKTANLCKKLGIKFIFSSSCSVYGKGINGHSDETSDIFPQTPYSLNKVQIEQDLTKITDKNFTPIIFRFATAFGLSPRMRFDLVINMFTAMAYTSGKIILNSDGKAWRPNVYVDDICKAIKHAIEFTPPPGRKIILNVGDTSQNYQIIDLAKIVQEEIPGSEITFINRDPDGINKELIRDRKIQDGVDSRNYKISFGKIKKTFPGFKCDWTVQKGVKEMLKKFKKIRLTKEIFENVKFYRLQRLELLIKSGFLSEDLFWIKKYQSL